MRTAICSKCKNEFSEKEFYLRKDLRSKSGLKSWCKGCIRSRNNNHYRNKSKDYEWRKNKAEVGRDWRQNSPTFVKNSWRRQGIDMDMGTFDAQLIYQKGKCANPNCPTHQDDIGFAFNVDHNHDTGEVRGLLCSRCNVLLGWLEKSPAKLFGLLQYAAIKDSKYV